MEYSIINFEESLTEKMALMWRSSKELAFGQEDIHSFEENVHFIKNVLSKENTILLAIKPNSEKVLGMIAFTTTTIAQLYVNADYLNHGIGTKLLNIAKEKSEDKLELFTFQRNDIARNFYEKHGFTEIGRNYKNELNLPDIKYEWTKKRNGNNSKARKNSRF